MMQVRPVFPSRPSQLGTGIVLGLRTRVAVIVVAACAYWAFVGCADAPQAQQNGFASSHETSTGEPDNWLSDAISSIPADDYESTYIRFANLKSAREVSDATDFKGLESLEQGGASLPWAYDYILAEAPGKHHSSTIYRETGINLWGLDFIMWAGDANPLGDGAHITLIRGGFNDDIAERLKLLNYNSDTHSNITWYYTWSDYQQRNLLRRSSPFSTDVGTLNAIAPVDDNSLLIRRFPENMEHQIEVHQGSQPNLRDEAPYRELAQVMGNELLAGAFVAPEYIRHSWSDVQFTTNPHRLPAYAPESEAWGVLEDYTVAIIGYGVRDGVEYNTFALHYSDPDKAERNADEFKLRLSAMQIHLFSSLDDAHDQSFRYPSIAKFCETIEVRALRYTRFSVLVADCPIPSTNDHASVDLLTARGLWNYILFFQTLHFLVPDLSHIK